MSEVSAVQCSAVEYSAVQYNTVECNAVQFSSARTSLGPWKFVLGGMDRSNT